MSKKKVTLTEAKEILESEKVFYNGENKFNVVDAGKYSSGVTIVVPQEWKIGAGKRAESPIKYEEIRELTAEMNIDFNGDESVLLGEYRVSKNGKPVFELTKPTKARDVMIKINWGGSFNSTSGLGREEAKEIGAKFFKRSSSNGGGLGRDYLVLPVGFVKDREPRDVSELLKKVEENQNIEEAKMDKSIAEADARINNSIANRERILKMAEPIIEEIKKYKPDYKYEALEEYFKSTGGFFYERYDENLIKKLKGYMEFTKDGYQRRKKYEPQYMSMKEVLKDIEISIKSNQIGVFLRGGLLDYEKEFDYTQSSYENFLNKVKELQNKYIEKQQEITKLENNIKQNGKRKQKENLVDDIIKLVKEKSAAEEKMKKVEELVQKYEEQVKENEKEQSVEEI